MTSKLFRGFILTLFCTSLINSYAQYTSIPDANFEQALIDQGIDSEAVLDGQILTADVNSLTYLGINNKGIADLTGIEDFVNLGILNCNSNMIDSLPLASLNFLFSVSANSNQIEWVDLGTKPGLASLYLGYNQLDEIDLSGLPALDYLILNGNPITTVDLSANTALNTLRLENTSLNSIDISNLTNLTDLRVTDTNISTIDLSQNVDLSNLKLSGNQLTELDLSENTDLITLSALSNLLTHIDITGLDQLESFGVFNNELESLDFSLCPNLSYVDVTNNNLHTLNVQNGTNFQNELEVYTSANPNLYCVTVDDPDYSTTEWGSWSSVEFSLDCGSSQDCSAFNTAPVDLSKSFDPVNGVQDRLQVKFYKGTGQEKYSLEDNAACDIEYWAYRYRLAENDPWIQIPTASRDTSRMPYTTVKKNNGKSLFKWPIKYRLNNGANQVQPNHGYQWRVRCYCDQGAEVNGSQVISPWSDVKFFNTPAFDPSTGIYTPPAEGSDWSVNKSSLIQDLSMAIYPNPNEGKELRLNLQGFDSSNVHLEIMDITGVKIFEGIVDAERAYLLEQDLNAGIYLVSVVQGMNRLTEKMIVK